MGRRLYQAALMHTRRGLHWLVRWRAPRCGARRRVWVDWGGGWWAAIVLARRGLRWPLRWRAPRCGARRRVG